MKEIAAILNLSEKTVEFHKHHIMEAFDLKSNAALVLFAVEARPDRSRSRTFISRSSHPRDFPSREKRRTCPKNKFRSFENFTFGI